MKNLQNRHDLTDKQWGKIEPIIKEKLSKRGGSNANDNRVFVNACLWIVIPGGLGEIYRRNTANSTL